MDAVPLVPTHSPVGAAAAAAAPDSGDGHHPLRRLFSASVLISLLGRDIGMSILPAYHYLAVNM